MKRFIFVAAATVALAFLVAPQCTVCDEDRWGYGYGAFDRYDVHPTSVTAGGIGYDPSGLPIAPELIDRLTGEVEKCLASVEADAGVARACMQYAGTIDRKSFVVKIANDWVLSCDGSQQLLPVLAGSAGCIAKGLTPSEQCPCRWRAGIECPNQIITTPSFYLYKDALTRFVTGCADPWAYPSLATCVSPSTTPLSDGTDPNNGL